jgi:hypothetical protein
MSLLINPRITSPGLRSLQPTVTCKTFDIQTLCFRDEDLWNATFFFWTGVQELALFEGFLLCGLLYTQVPGGFSSRGSSRESRRSE